jgi:16S rRNA (cytosine967-C5)-methyltransferase
VSPDRPRRHPAGQRPRAGNAPRRTGPPRAAGDPARLVAFAALRAVAERDAYANLVLPGLLRRHGIGGRDAALATELTYGTLRGQGTYDAILALCADRPLEQVDGDVLDVLRIGAHQLLATRIPPHAAVAATVDVARAELGPGAAGFVNAVLRRVSEHDLADWLQVVAPAADTDADGHLAVVTSHPVWVIRALRDGLTTSGRDATELAEVLAADNSTPPVTIAALPGLATTKEIADPVDNRRLSPFAVDLTGPPDAVPAVREGRARVQDDGSQLVALALAAAPLVGPDAGRWLDVCAGPGGKAALLAATLLGRRQSGELPGDARLVTVESAEHRVELVRTATAGVLALAADAVEFRHGDGRDVGGDEPGRYDRVLLDVPCTGLGSLRRRPEARWRRTPGDVAALAPLQRELLRSALDAVRPGGVVCYATCSPHPNETRFAVADVLRRRDDVERLDVREVLTEVTGGRIGHLGAGPDVQLWTDRHGTDGMYLALLRRR